MLFDPPEVFYDELVDKIGQLLFGVPEARMTYPYRILVDAWLKENKLGPEDIKKWFQRVGQAKDTELLDWFERNRGDSEGGWYCYESAGGYAVLKRQPVGGKDVCRTVRGAISMAMKRVKKQ